MVAISLPDGSQLIFDSPPQGIDIAQRISPSLAKNVVAIRIDNILCDLTQKITQDATITLITRKDTEIALEILRHSTAHLMAQAVKELFPDTQVAIGPAIEDGFYYDFSPKNPFTPENLADIEERMREIVARKETITQHIWSRKDAIDFFQKQNEFYKVELINDLPEEDNITIYQQGGFIDLCRGPHMPHTGYIGTSFKLMSVAGAYWRGDSNREMLQRIYGTAWFDKKSLDIYLYRIEEAERRDHRKIGKNMGLFHLQDVAAGSVFWHDKGWRLYRIVQNYVRDKLEKADYMEVNTPKLVNKLLWEQSGHWEKFRENMFIATSEHDEHTLALKPMNCPCHVQIFKQGLKSYRNLPLRMAEFGSCFRNEPSGALHGLMRVRSFTQDDAHIFCTEEQIVSETKAFCDLLLKIYSDFGFNDVIVKFSDRPEKRAGDDHTWDKAESALLEAVQKTNLDIITNPGEGAFYGPKLEFVLKDAIGRDWQLGTFQVDFVLPERLNASYTGADGEKYRPVMLHRAILGSFERFIGILIEHYAGNLPPWLAPTQAVVATITRESESWATKVTQLLKKQGIRVETDLRNEKINYKVREYSLAKIPFILAIGKKEMNEKTVTIRQLGSKGQTTLGIEEAIAFLTKEARSPSDKT